MGSSDKGKNVLNHAFCSFKKKDSSLDKWLLYPFLIALFQASSAANSDSEI